ncbi:hypothetical protein BCR44DRAFT_342671 [Catenaria anguillulae PL171]|uniref:F-box domain-containing protein n=1 Tax=Catenaria anguillulae PL171 TaxID=765915 RepID=A0A1Y2HIE9_9FUNG|nr:hypothetical protein BCR44DRAFT_342671 [Catenaria anguillulae PL171]
MLTSCNSAHRHSALGLLPTELIHTVLALARPRSITAAACRHLANNAANSTLVSHTWRNRVLLGDGTALTLCRVFGTEVRLHRDHLTLVLRSLLPQPKVTRRWFHGLPTQSFQPG